jgi:hypothetical protein
MSEPTDNRGRGVLTDWSFSLEEVSAGVYRARGIDAAGRSVEKTGTGSA